MSTGDTSSHGKRLSNATVNSTNEQLPAPRKSCKSGKQSVKGKSRGLLYSSPPTKSDAFEEFKRERGSEINRIFIENKSKLLCYFFKLFKQSTYRQELGYYVGMFETIIK